MVCNILKIGANNNFIDGIIKCGCPKKLLFTLKSLFFEPNGLMNKSRMTENKSRNYSLRRHLLFGIHKYLLYSNEWTKTIAAVWRQFLRIPKNLHACSAMALFHLHKMGVTPNF